MANFNLTDLALKSICPNNSAILDDKGMPSIQVFIPKFKLSDVITGASNTTHPAFIVNGNEIKGFWFGKYNGCKNNGRAYSLPCEDPGTGVTLDQSLAHCKSKGAGWHLTTNAEWAAVALWCLKNGTIPKGNNNYGKDHSETMYKAIPTYLDGNGQTCRVATGTGPIEWSHDHTMAGIWDMNGNVWEWMGGIRFVYGELQIIENNNAADNTVDQSATSNAWKAIDAATGSLITPDGNGTTAGSIKLDYVSGHWQWTTTITSKIDQSRNGTFAATTFDGSVTFADSAKELLYALCLAPASQTASDYGGDYFYANNGVAERSVARGGNWASSGDAGVFLLNARDPRATSGNYIGLRPAFIEELVDETEN